MASKYEGRVVNLENARGIKTDVHERLAELEKSIAHLPEAVQRERSRVFYLKCTDSELKELMRIGPNPERWMMEAVASGVPPEGVLRTAADKKAAEEMRQETETRMKFRAIKGAKE